MISARAMHDAAGVAMSSPMPANMLAASRTVVGLPLGVGGSSPSVQGEGQGPTVGGDVPGGAAFATAGLAGHLVQHNVFELI